MPSQGWVYAAQIGWAVFLLACTGVKLAQFSVSEFIVHFTNWSWVYQALFYSLSLLVASRGCYRVGVCCIAWLFLPLFAIIWAVAIGVQILLVYDDDFLESLLTEYDMGLITVGNDVYHMYPVIAGICYLFLNFPTIYYSLAWCYGYNSTSAWRVVVTLYQLFGGAVFVYGLYLIVLAGLGTSIGEVYQTDIAWYTALLALIGVSLLVNGIILSCMCCSCALGSSPRLAQYAERRQKQTDFELLLEPEQDAAPRPEPSSARLRY